ncbi:hypothetical protein SNE40_018348 [Patella caerulea]|uniref:Uncharacterized protein n=1 Tax=Patella caerulea TaxID=87958 RepID=A0AAN8PBC5_PATCE
MQVLRCMLYHIKEGATSNRTKFQAAKIVLSKIVVFYEKADIPMISELYACNKLVKLVENNQKLRDIPLDRRQTPWVLKKVEIEKTDLAKTCSLWPKNAEMKKI